jgi:hypothetical protein
MSRLIAMPSDTIVQFLIALIEREPDLYLDELAEELYEQHGVKASLPMICRTMKRIGLTSKKVGPPTCFMLRN